MQQESRSWAILYATFSRAIHNDRSATQTPVAQFLQYIEYRYIELNTAARLTQQSNQTN